MSDCFNDRRELLLIPIAVSMAGFIGTVMVVGIVAFLPLVLGVAPISPPEWLRWVGIGSLATFPVGILCLWIYTRLTRTTK